MCFAAFQELESKFSTLDKADQIAQLHDLLRPHFLRRVKKEVMPYLPPKAEIFVPLSMTPMQRDYYKAILERYVLLRRHSRGPNGAPLKLTSILTLEGPMAHHLNSLVFSRHVFGQHCRTLTQSKADISPLSSHISHDVRLCRNYKLLYAASSGGKRASLLNIMSELQKVCNHPYILPNAEPTSLPPDQVHMK